MKQTVSIPVFLVLILYSSIALCYRERVKFKPVVRRSEHQDTDSISVEPESVINKDKILKVLLAIKIKNHAHSLPTFLATLETLNCPQRTTEDKEVTNKCHLWVVFDDCSDSSYDLFVTWLAETRPLFDTIIMLDTHNDKATRDKHKELDPLYFSSNLKHRALIFALERNFTHVFFLKADTILTNQNTVEILINKRKPIVAPLLTSTETLNSNFWMNSKNDREHEILYLSIYNRQKLGCFKVHGLFDCFMISLRDHMIARLLNVSQNEQSLNLNEDELINYKAVSENILMHVCNREFYGYLPDQTVNALDSDSAMESFLHLRLQHLLNGPNRSYNEPLAVSEHLAAAAKPKKRTRLGFDQIYVVNLARRSDRRARIQATLDDMNLAYQMFEAVDGRSIDDEYVRKLGAKPLPLYRDPYNDRPLNFGEIGCFLSHYFIWKDAVAKGYKKILILEDDAKFALYFKSTIRHLLNSMSEKRVEWDLLYLGRKIMAAHERKQTFLREIGQKNGYGIVKPGYTHWTISYALTLEGAKKLLEPAPLNNLVPVDEYLPIMFDKQPNAYWASFFPERSLHALAVHPPLVHPTHYTGDPSHVSDTEQSQVLNLEEPFIIESGAAIEGVSVADLEPLDIHHIEL